MQIAPAFVRSCSKSFSVHFLPICSFLSFQLVFLSFVKYFRPFRTKSRIHFTSLSKPFSVLSLHSRRFPPFSLLAGSNCRANQCLIPRLFQPLSNSIFGPLPFYTPIFVYWVILPHTVEWGNKRAMFAHPLLWLAVRQSDDSCQFTETIKRRQAANLHIRLNGRIRSWTNPAIYMYWKQILVSQSLGNLTHPFRRLTCKSWARRCYP